MLGPHSLLFFRQFSIPEAKHSLFPNSLGLSSRNSSNRSDSSRKSTRNCRDQGCRRIRDIDNNTWNTINWMIQLQGIARVTNHHRY